VPGYRKLGKEGATCAGAYPAEVAFESLPDFELWRDDISKCGDAGPSTAPVPPAIAYLEYSGIAAGIERVEEEARRADRANVRERPALRRTFVPFATSR